MLGTIIGCGVVKAATLVMTTPLVVDPPGKLDCHPSIYQLIHRMHQPQIRS